MTEAPSLYSRIWNAVWNGAGLCDDECRDITCNVIAALGDDEVFPTWQPIETAPKDELVDVWLTDGLRWCDCYYDRITNTWRTSRPSGRLLSISASFVSHWMPRPAPPSP